MGAATLRMVRRVGSWQTTKASGCVPWSSARLTPAKEGWNSDPWPSTTSQWSSSLSGESASAAPDAKSDTTASMAMPAPLMRMPVCPVARKSAFAPRSSSAR